MDIYSDKDTIIAPITSTVGGSVSMIRISGKKAVEVAARFFSPHNLYRAEGGRFFHGRILDEQNNLVDDVVLLVFRSPHSFTGEDVVEISCHANPIIVQDLLQLFVRNGCRPAEPGEFSKRAFINGKLDLTQAEAIADLISSRSKRAIQNSLSLLGGSLSAEIKQIRRELIDLSGLLELELDFNEDGLDIIPPDELREKINSALNRISRLIESYSLGKELQKGIEVLIVGRPNVGKSSLMNALLGRDRVIVSQIPGTTRDVIHEDIMVEDTLIRFIDSAGIRMTNDMIESAGVEKAMSLVEKASVILLILDLSHEPTTEDKNLLKTISSVYQEKVIIVGNKMDLAKNEKMNVFLKNTKYEKILVSAKTNRNINTLKQKIRSKIYKDGQPSQDDIIITNERQYEALLKTKKHLESVKRAADQHVGYEFLAVDMRNAIDYIGQLSGEITTDEILNSIFSRFCIGK